VLLWVDFKLTGAMPPVTLLPTDRRRAA